MTTTNGATPTINAEAVAKLESLVVNAFMMRNELMRGFLDPRRDIDEACGYPATFTPEMYRKLYDGDPIARRAVQLMPRECWQVSPSVYEEEKGRVATAFEKAWDDLGKSLSPIKSWYRDEKGSPIWNCLLRADELSGIGSFGILLIGIDDGLPLDQPAAGAPPDGVPATLAPDVLPAMQPLEGSDAQYFTAPYTPPQPTTKGPRKLLYLRPFDESLITITRCETNEQSPRYGQPIMYQVTFNDPNLQYGGIGLPTATRLVHWSRVIHLADNLGSSEIFGSPRLECPRKRLLDGCKLYGGSAEMYWRGAFPGLSIETNPTLGGDVEVDRAGLRDMMQDYTNNLSRYIALIGMTAKSLAPQVVDPTPQIKVQIEAICIVLGCPVRIFMGSERGELASSQDDSSWNDRVRHSQNNYRTPRIIVPFIDRLIALGVLPEPAQGYCVEWPDLDSQTDTQKAQVGLVKTQALAAYVAGNVESIFPPLDYLTRILGMDEEEALAILDAAASTAEDEMYTTPPAPEMPPGMDAGTPTEQGQPGQSPVPATNQLTTPKVVVSPTESAPSPGGG